MKVVSLNVNNFGGNCPKPLPKGYNRVRAVMQWREANRFVIGENVRRIVYFAEDYDVIFLHEVDTNCESWDLLLKMLGKTHALVLPASLTPGALKSGYKSITCAWIRHGIDYEQPEDGFSGSLRQVEIETDGITLLGVHANYEEAFWNSMTARFREKPEASPASSP